MNEDTNRWGGTDEEFRQEQLPSMLIMDGSSKAGQDTGGKRDADQ